MSNDVFISCASADKTWANALSFFLKKEGVTVFEGNQNTLDEATIEAAKQQLSESRLFLLIQSSAAMKSERVRTEITLANAQKKPMVMIVREQVSDPPELQS
ncbi:MAG: toll/interleukin-1 receptor domain-containing protein, partial [Chloroflexota bacterium]